MARHARSGLLSRGVGRAGRWLAAWAARTSARAQLGAAGPGGPAAARRTAREVATLAGVAAGVVAVFGVLLLLARHPLHGAPAPAAGRAASALGSGSAPSKASAQRTPAQPAATASAAVPPGASPTPPAAAPSASGQSGAAASAVSSPRPSGAAGVPAARGSAASSAAAAASAGTAPSGSAIQPGTPGKSGQAAPAPVAAAAAALPRPPLRAPVPGAVLAGFGWAYTPVFGDWQEHTGVDLAAPVGAPVVAPGAGVVAAVRDDSLWGWVVSITLDHGYSTNVSGLGKVEALPGQAVRAGDFLGFVGASPPAEANLPPHVYWQLFSGARPVDPAQG